MSSTEKGPAAERPEDDLTVEPVEGDGEAWNRFVLATEGSSFAHLWQWRSILAGLYGYECRYLVATGSDGAWHGVLPLVRVNSRIFGHHLLSVPLLNYGGAIGTPAARARLSEHALAEARRSGARSLVLRNREPVAAELDEANEKVAVLLDLPDSPETLWRETFRSKLRSQIRRAQKEGMEVRFGAGHRQAFYRVFARNMRDLGTPVHSYLLFDDLVRTFPDRVVFGVVYRDDLPVAAGCGFLWKGEFEMTWASSLREYSRMAPNMLLYWAFMEEMIARGVRVFNFGRCTPGGGTHSFKRQWGGRDVALPWLRWSRRETAPVAPDERPALRWARATWSRLPTPLATRMGPALARELPWW